MLTLSTHNLQRLTVPVSTAWLLADCMEARGKQDLLVRQKPELIRALRELAIIQSAESSNRIEGVTVPPDRLRPVVLGRSRPSDRSEEELAGYRRALDWIFSRKRRVAITVAIVRHLHKLAQGPAPDAGQLNTRDNEIIELLPAGGRRLRFTPTSAKSTAGMLHRLCTLYAEICEAGSLPALLTIGTFVFDFLCIHPFRDGNGRVSRLLTTLLMQQHGFEVGRFVSLERLTEQRKAEYYSVLARCSRGWHEGKNEIVPWWNLALGIVRSAYREFEQQLGSARPRPAKTELIRRAALAHAEPFALGELAAEVPAVSPQLIKKVLADLKRSGQLKSRGHGRGALWQIVQ